jgi:hypothetical protein
VLGDGGQNVDGQPVGLGHIASDEVRAALHQVGDESDVAGQPVKTDVVAWIERRSSFTFSIWVMQRFLVDERSPGVPRGAFY